MNIFEEEEYRKLEYETRRHFLRKCTTGLGGLAFASLFGCNNLLNEASKLSETSNPMSPKKPMFVPKAKRVIYLHMAGAPSQLELFDYKPDLQKLDGKDCPASLLEGKRFAFIQGVPKMLGPQFSFQQYGQSGAWVSDRLPHFSKMVDDVTFLKAMHTDEFNHAPAQLLLHTGSPRLGRPSMGSWVTYGLGSENENLPGYVVLVSGGKTPSAGKSVWGSGFLPSVYQGVQCRSKGDPVLYLSDPKGVSRELREKTINSINEINEMEYQEVGDPEILTRISQYEMAFKMQMSVPEAMDISKEPAYIHNLYGTEVGKSSFANNCLLARRLAERDVRFIQLFHWGWDAHGAGREEALDIGFKDRCMEVDQAMSALLLDLKQRGLLDETLVVWGGEFGRTPMRENRGGKEMAFVGRDHLLEAFTIWMAGGGIKQGMSYGQTDEIGYYGVKDRVHVHDLQATILHLLGMDHEKFTYKFQGRNFRLTDVHGEVVKSILA
ncbi:DUF1501 domain-containing protein [Fulvivirgaceae bacterium BMA10]|uniref:DUF1501 domain-containing protein n=1 Tax=Splendidivirga corallicola TaxID=3051826 RepID=A0ABT8KXM5_9BACT|nr:DUF1501 domain-containing protein [Fulvivirgaceae bacterium BMA10]